MRLDIHVGAGQRMLALCVIFPDIEPESGTSQLNFWIFEKSDSAPIFSYTTIQ